MIFAFGTKRYIQIFNFSDDITAGITLPFCSDIVDIKIRGSLILSAEMMLRHMGWNDAADLIINGVEGAIAAKTVTYDFERLMPDATLLKCSEFGDAVIEHMGI